MTQRGGAPLNWAPSRAIVFGCRGEGSWAICYANPQTGRGGRLLGGREFKQYVGFAALRP